MKTKVSGKLSPKGTFVCPWDKSNLLPPDRTLEALGAQVAECLARAPQSSGGRAGTRECGVAWAVAGTSA